MQRSFGMKKTIFIPLDIEQEGKDYLREKGYELIIADTINKKSLLRQVRNCDAILTRSNVIIDEEVIKAGEHVQIISKYGVGLNNIDVDYATKQGIYVTNTPEANANAVAEHVMTFILMLAKNVKEMERALRQGDFNIRSRMYSEDIIGKTLGIIGLGRIGKLVAKKAHDGFGMEIIGYDPFSPPEIDWIMMADSMQKLLKEADFVSLHLPLLPETEHIISTNEFGLMKPTAHFINTSRGGTVDEVALIQAVKSGKIAGAGLDVFEEEPPNMTSELFTLENMIVTPHSAALTKEGSIKMALHAAIQIDQVLNGKEPSWPVNQIEKTQFQK